MVDVTINRRGHRSRTFLVSPGHSHQVAPEVSSESRGRSAGPKWSFLQCGGSEVPKFRRLLELFQSA